MVFVCDLIGKVEAIARAMVCEASTARHGSVLWPRRQYVQQHLNLMEENKDLEKSTQPQIRSPHSSTPHAALFLHFTI